MVNYRSRNQLREKSDEQKIMVKNILITGGGGILGTAFIDQLLNLGHSVSTCEFNADKTNFLQNKFGNQNNFYVHQCDITKEKEVETFLKEHTMI